MLAHLLARRTRQDAQARAAGKIRLLALLQDREMEEIDRMRWGRFLDWLLPLPAELAHTVTEAVTQMRKGDAVPYVTSWERIGIEKGLEKGRDEGRREARHDTLREAIELVLTAKVGPAGKELVEQIQKVEDAEQLRRFLTAVGNPSSTVESLRDLLSRGSN